MIMAILFHQKLINTILEVIISHTFNIYSHTLTVQYLNEFAFVSISVEICWRADKKLRENCKK